MVQRQGCSKSEKRIIGTSDLVPATNFITGIAEDGELLYVGTYQLIWEAAETVMMQGSRVFVDEDYMPVLESDVEWR
ncbi:MAG: hypothetical protein JO314_07735 [Acidobacteria bacterium]|nr:hypothetical protein [Acidobacteriota bacterium]